MSTHYTAGGMPLAFTQEDFLVISFFGSNSVFIKKGKQIAVPKRDGG